MRLAVLAVFPLLLGVLQAQSLDVAPAQLDLKMPVGGPLPPVTTLSITASGAWTITFDADAYDVRPKQGTGNARVTVTPVDWRPAGEYASNITVTSQGLTRTISGKLTVVPRSEPKFVYAQPPTGCQTVTPGLPADNLAVCAAPALTPPKVGSSYLDPNFGTRVRVVANGYHGYSSPSPISANNKYAVVELDEKNATAIELMTGKAVEPTFGFEGVMWDAKNEKYLYAISGNTVRRMDVSNGDQRVVADYGRGDLRFSRITNGGTGEITRDNWLAFVAPQERQICTLDLTASKTYCGAVPDGVAVDFPTMSKGVDKVSGQRYVIGVVGSGAFLIYAVNTAQQRLDLAGRGPENVSFDGGNRNGICESGEACFNGSHADTTEDAAGNQFLIFAMESQHPCEYSMVSLQLSKGDQMGLPAETGGGLKHVMTLFRCGGDKWADFHMGCAKAAPACVLSTTYQGFGEVRDPNDSSPLPTGPYVGEIMVIINNGAEVRRLMMHRSIGFKTEESNGYWSTPRAAISADGGFVIATTNFGEANKHRVVVIDSGYRNPRLAAGNPVQNAADYSTKVAPGTLAILYGTDLTDCEQDATYPLPTSLCEVSVHVADQPAFMFYVRPSQIAFFVPRAISTPVNAAVKLNTISIYGDRASAASSFPVATSAPALFAKTLSESTDLGVLLYDVGWNQRALHLGEYATTFAVGLGPTSPFVEDGAPSPAVEPLARLGVEPQLFINDMRQTLVYAGLVPGMSGVYQLVWVINPATPIRNGSQPNLIWIQDGSAESQRLLIDLLPAV